MSATCCGARNRCYHLWGHRFSCFRLRMSIVHCRVRLLATRGIPSVLQCSSRVDAVPFVDYRALCRQASHVPGTDTSAYALPRGAAMTAAQAGPHTSRMPSGWRTHGRDDCVLNVSSIRCGSATITPSTHMHVDDDATRYEQELVRMEESSQRAYVRRHSRNKAGRKGM